MKVGGVRTWKELQGIPCIDQEQPLNKKSICTSRSFGEMVDDYGYLSEAVANFAAACARKLREQKTAAGVLTVFILTNPFRDDLSQYYKNRTVILPVATNVTGELVTVALSALQDIYIKGYQFKKAGVIVSDIVPQDQAQGNLFDTLDRPRHRKACEIMDSINHKEGRDTLKIAAQGYSKKWKLKDKYLSKRFTTNLDDIIEIK